MISFYISAFSSLSFFRHFHLAQIMNTQQPYQVQGQIPYTQGNPGTGQPPQYAAYPHPAAQGNYPYQPGYPPNQEYPNNQTTVPLPDQHVSNSNVDGDYEAKSFEFNDKTIRRGFIRRVYGLLSVKTTKKAYL